MARFPSKEAEVFALGQEMLSGLSANAAVYPSPPVTVAELGAAFGAYMTANSAAVAAQAAAEQATTTKDEALQTLTDGMRADLRYAENTVNFDDDQLKLIGWGGRKARTSLEASGQARTLEAPRQGDGWVFLDWKEPVDNCKAALRSARLRPTRLSDVSAHPGRGRMSAWPSRAKSPSRIRSAARNGSTASSPSTKPAKARRATPSWPCCEVG